MLLQTKLIIAVFAFYACDSPASKQARSNKNTLIQSVQDSFTRNEANSRVKKSEKSIDLTKYLNVKEYGAKGDGKTNDVKALNEALTALVDTEKIGVYFPSGVYLVKGNTVSIRGNNIIILGESPKTTIIKGVQISNVFDIGKTEGTISIKNIKFDGMEVNRAILNVNGSLMKGSLLVENCNFLNGRLYNVYLKGVHNASFVNNVFRGRAHGKSMGIYMIDGCENIQIKDNRFLYLYNGVYVVGRIVKGSGKNISRINVAPNTNITFTNNYIDFGWYLFPHSDAGRGRGIAYTKNSLVDPKANFPKYSNRVYVRILAPLVSQSTAQLADKYLTDNTIDFIAAGVQPKDLVTSGLKIGVVKTVHTHKIEIEEWLMKSSLLPAAPSKNKIIYAVDRIILGKVTSNTRNKVVVKEFSTLMGKMITPKNKCRYEILTERPNYPFYTSPNNGNFKVSGNTVKRGWSDQIVIHGTHSEISDNRIEGGQDMGITIHGSYHKIINNTIINQGTGGIWLDTKNSIVSNNKITDPWLRAFTSQKGGFINETPQAKNNKISKNSFIRKIMLNDNITNKVKIKSR